ncbi:Ig-like domain-containing protein [Maribacter arcticus]|uniref:Ig-like domain-containing protein n=1 Tax=Maribacter arcticus TaxID=561365 RepID=UPI0030038804
MSKFLSFISKLTLSFFAFLFLFSCSKDADLLSEYVITKNDGLQSIALLADDSFYMAPGQSSILMDVLNNDNFSDNTNVSIIETSLPINGSVTINNDNTLTYTPWVEPTPVETTTTPEETTPVETTPVETTPVETTQEEAIPEEDTFTYTAEIVDEETGTTTKEEATVTVSSSSTNMNMGELLAFPGAEGFGKFTTGGRGGKVIHVTNLNDSGSGSFREAIETTGPRTIVFDVGGEIKLDNMIKLGVGNSTADPKANALRENVTIAGETAPFPGITITTSGDYSSGYGALLDIQASNVILRYVTFRVDDNNVSAMDALQVVNPWVNDGIYSLENIIIDHVSMSNGSDENFSIQGLDNATVQNSMMTNSDNAYNFLFGYKNYNFSFIGNYMSHTSQRNVLVGYGTDGSTSEYINNITYGYEEGMNIVWGNNTDVIGNIYKSFVNNKPRNTAIAWKANAINNLAAAITDGSFYFSDNFQLNPHDYDIYNSDALTNISASRVITNSKIPSWEKTQTSIENRVFGSKAPGNSLHQDSMDAEAILDYFKNTGSFNSLSVPIKTGSSHPDEYDTDNDGMADSWEKNYFGDLSKTANGDHDEDGYSNIEVFFFWLTE